MQEEVSTKLSKAQIKGMLYKRFKDGETPYAKALANIIVEHLSKTGRGLGDVILTMLGESTLLPYKIGEKIRVPFKDLDSYYINEEATREAGLIDENECMLAIFKEIDHYADSYPFKVEVAYINKKGEPDKRNFSMDLDMVKGRELDDDLPF